ncbi:alpha/beta fold hydrolase [Erythrobacter litoralis]|uniref:Probable epoxide hydrolase n=1 Tax=Erythrobacter litoralis (strain HTCC2594) TaxID=314225 RepID=Q2N9R2_ERYLH|nr:alpha/beta hydrolase [Erythrobacter litoralis]ABC63579.1 probable epoxide hydrolase [Erythrobacter litoralis HTCC2594]
MAGPSLGEWKAKAQHFAYDGLQIAFWTGGKPDARPLLLVHGYPTASWDWHRVWETLGSKYHLVAPDMIGFGLSDKPRSGYSIHRQADMHVALLDHLGIGAFDALVHDYGVSVGQELLARRAERSAAQGLGQTVFLNGGIFPDQHRPRPIQKLGTSPLGFLVGLLTNREKFGRSFSEVFGPDTQPGAQELDEFWDLVSHNGGNRIMHKLLHYIADRKEHAERWFDALRIAQGDIGLINGALDPVSGRHAYEAWRERLPDARHHLIPTVGHYPQVEDPQTVSRVTLDWLAR